MTQTVRGTVVFDLDGTLVDSAPDLADALDTLMTERGLAPFGLAGTRQLIGHGMAELVRGALDRRGEPAPKEMLDATVQRFLTLYTAHLSRKSQPYPGAAEVLARLHRDGWRLVVCTNKLESSARALLGDLGLLSAFSLVAGPDTFGVAKPNPGHLLACLPEDPAAQRHAVLVGDSEVDIACAKAAGIPVIAASWGYARRPLADLDPDALVTSLSEVPDAIVRIFGRQPGG